MPRISRKLSLLVALACSVAGAGLSATPAAAQILSAPKDLSKYPFLKVKELRKMYGDAQSRYVKIGDLTIHYKDEGPRDAPVLLMVHGSESSMRTYDRETELLKDRYRIVRIDLPSYGLSDGPTDKSLETLQPTDIPIGVLDELGITKVTYVGVSSGGTMGMYLAARRPDMVERLILSNTPSDPVDVSHLEMSQEFLDAVAKAQETGWRGPDFWDLFLTYFAGDGSRISEQTKKEYFDFYRRFPEKHLVGLIARIGDGKQAAVEMAKVKTPTLLIWGTADPLLPESAADAIARYLKNAQISRVLMPDVGHYPPLEVPDRFAQLVAAYVEAGTPLLPTQAIAQDTEAAPQP
ncbi:alpha/beta fold hydrolase [Novosphingobium mangrovi (ex Hu et al. 2023)]|uniref:Alpha/beta hydrolase n=1 Tax=Novosphingobium mangrovi (ex Hu et al. 2023) TaxID=2930094 RepID=A0ABT0AFH0_9SPHN|nr:alpha/beta hydrolase [Novosphingobium mangrovi (ex Hu et al. 2023)]MCJ1961919.1 alpha/beta hydrolase [Novosphingobium mangrovi (ex Hu et al. 2023)]